MNRRPPRLLLVDDHEDTITVLAKLLQARGYEVDSARGVQSALAYCAASHFDLVVSDIGLPDGTGHELMRTLRARYGLRGIALTGRILDDDRREAMEAGFDEFVLKPAPIDTIHDAIRRILGSFTTP